MSKQYFVYILASQKYGTLYIGMTSDLAKRVNEHTLGLVEGFTKEYNVKILVYYEIHQDVNLAIQREKRLKVWKRDWKIRLIEEKNPEWIDLYPKLN